MAFKPRPKQAEVLAYTGGKMGVSAVPGSGKTKTLSALAAQLITRDLLGEGQEVLVVTLVNAAVDNFSRSVAAFVKEAGLLPGFGYRVRTLHGLANDILRERPGLLGLDEGFQIVDEREANDILQDAVNTWLRTHPHFAMDFLAHDLEDYRINTLLRDHWPREVQGMASAFIKQAKDWELTPERVAARLERFEQPLPLAAMCHEIYVNYERGLRYRGAVDFNDLIRLALRALELDEAYLARLRHKWPYILEDEAQDSSLLQEKILRTLAGDGGNWVRVGDPNQSIYETFTTARPEYLLNFLREDGVTARELPNSGRSTQSILALANHLIDWTQAKHPVEAVREWALHPPYIEPTPPGDPQPNPPDQPKGVYLRSEAYTPGEEIKAVVDSLERWLPDHPDQTAAVLVPRNDRGAQVALALKQAGLEVVELLRASSSTRQAAGSLVHVLHALTDPNSARSLGWAFRVWRRADRDDPVRLARVDRVVKVLEGLSQVEDFIWPRPDADWLDGPAVSALAQDDESFVLQLEQFRVLVRRWQQAVVLPVDQLILTLAQDLFETAADLAIAHSLAVYMGRFAQNQPEARLPEFTVELRLVAQNKRSVPDISEEGTGYDPDAHRGKVTIATMHKAKGLEWDRVYLMSVNNYDFPSAQPQDRFIGEKWFLRDTLNLQAEALQQLEVAVDPLGFDYKEGEASKAARIEYAAERLRLLYVGITRARRELVITWNNGRDGKVLQATPFLALGHWWAGRQSS